MLILRKTFHFQARRRLLGSSQTEPRAWSGALIVAEHGGWWALPPQTGMLIDHMALGKAARDIAEELDGTILDDVLDGDEELPSIHGYVPSCEVISGYIYERLHDQFPQLIGVHLRDGVGNSATFLDDDRSQRFRVLVLATTGQEGW